MNKATLGFLRDLTNEFLESRNTYSAGTITETRTEQITINDNLQWSETVDKIKVDIDSEYGNSLFLFISGNEVD